MLVFNVVTKDGSSPLRIWPADFAVVVREKKKTDRMLLLRVNKRKIYLPTLHLVFFT